MRPNFILKTAKVKTSSGERAIKLDDIKFKDGGCPMGTVPIIIRRVSKEEYIQMRCFTKQYAAQRGANGLQPQPGTHVSVQSIPSTLCFLVIKVGKIRKVYKKHKSNHITHIIY